MTDELLEERLETDGDEVGDTYEDGDAEKDKDELEVLSLDDVTEELSVIIEVGVPVTETVNVSHAEAEAEIDGD